MRCRKNEKKTRRSRKAVMAMNKTGKAGGSEENVSAVVEVT
jgi:hypothetical protein